jgi:hypothetical protein
MHEFDRIQADYESLIPILDGNHHGYSGEYELSGGWDGVPVHQHRNFPLSENEELELTAKLLDVRNDQELDQFLGDIGNSVRDTVDKVGGAIESGAKAVGCCAVTVGRAIGRGAEAVGRAVGAGAQTVYNDVTRIIQSAPNKETSVDV